MRVRSVLPIVVIVASAVLAGCGSQKAPPAKPPQAAETLLDSVVKSVTDRENTVGNAMGYKFLDVKVMQNMLVVRIEGPKDDSVFRRTGGAMGALGEENLKTVQSVSVEYLVNGSPYVAAQVPKQALLDYEAGKMSKDDFLKQLKIGQSNVAQPAQPGASGSEKK